MIAWPCYWHLCWIYNSTDNVYLLLSAEPFSSTRRSNHEKKKNTRKGIFPTIFPGMWAWLFLFHASFYYFFFIITPTNSAFYVMARGRPYVVRRHSVAGHCPHPTRSPCHQHTHPGLGNFCINHLEPNHPNETNTYYESFSEIHVKTEELGTWRPQGHGRLWWLSAWQPSTPMVTAVAALNTADVSPKYLSGPWHRAIGCVEMYH